MGTNSKTILPGAGRAPAPLTLAPPRFVHWGKTLTKFVSAQLVVQAAGALSGILLVRALDQREYAYFTIAFAMQSTMSILADSGVGIGLTSIGGRVWQDPHRFGRLVNTAMRLRRRFALWAALVSTPILVWLLISNGAGGVYAGLLAFLVLLGLGFQLSAGVLMIVPRLCRQIGRLQRLDLISSAARLTLLTIAYFVFLNAAVAVVVTLCSVFLQYLLLTRCVADSIDTDAPFSGDDQLAIVRIVKNEAPNALFYCVQGQLTIWLISIFGSTQNVAEIGALARLGIIFSVIHAVMSGILLPTFARCQDSSQLRRRYLQIVCGFCLFGAALVGLAAIFPGQLLWVLGAKYAHLRGELILMMSLAAVSAVTAAMWSLNSTRAWIRYSWLNIPGVLAAQAILLTLLDITTIEGVLWFGILSAVPTFALNVVLTVRGLLGKAPLVTHV